jgi:hypothetical protein
MVVDGASSTLQHPGQNDRRLIIKRKAALPSSSQPNGSPPSLATDAENAQAAGFVF